MSRKKKEQIIDTEQQALDLLAKEIEKRKKAREAMLANRYIEVETESETDRQNRLIDDPACWNNM